MEEALGYYGVLGELGTNNMTIGDPNRNKI